MFYLSSSFYKRGKILKVVIENNHVYGNDKENRLHYIYNMPMIQISEGALVKTDEDYNYIEMVYHDTEEHSAPKFKPLNNKVKVQFNELVDHSILVVGNPKYKTNYKLSGLKNKLNIENDTYNDTIFGGIQGFLKVYDPDFKAQDMKITADYPLYNNLIGKLDGVEFIKEYLNSIYLENIFCKKFSEEKMNYLLYEYSHDYKELIINIFEIVLLEAIGCKLAKRDIQDLAISIDELNEIYAMLKDKEKVKIKQGINKAYQEICEELLLDNEQLQKYIEKNFDYIVEIITNALKQNTLDKVFIAQKFIEN